MSGDLRTEESSSEANRRELDRRKSVRSTELGEQLRDKVVRKDAYLELKESTEFVRSRNGCKFRFLSTGNAARHVEYSNSTRKIDQLSFE